MIVVGYTADPFGRAALEHGIAEAKLRGSHAAGDQLDDGRRLRRPPFAQSGEVHDVEERLADCGVEFELDPAGRRRHRRRAAEGDGPRRRRAAGDRHPAPHPGRQAAAGQRFAAACCWSARSRCWRSNPTKTDARSLDSCAGDFNLELMPCCLPVVGRHPTADRVGVIDFGRPRLIWVIGETVNGHEAEAS